MSDSGTRVGLLDPSRRTRNIGDHVIVESVLREVPELKAARRIASHDFPGLREAKGMRASRVLVFAGTNVLGPDMWRHRQFPSIGVLSLLMRRKTAYLGVGWGAPAEKFDTVTARLLRSSMLPGLPIGVRDTYTLERLRASDVPARFIACPTTWSLPAELPSWDGITEVVTTVTDYRPDAEADNALLRELSRRFSRVIIWLQGANDGAYVKSLDLPQNVEVDAESTLEHLGSILDGKGYLGTRLHGGIHALQQRRPTGIVAVDHRATSLGRDIGLPVTERRADIAPGLDDVIGAAAAGRRIQLPKTAIEEWTGALREALIRADGA